MPKSKKTKGFTTVGVKRWIEYIRQMQKKSGPYYEKWREAMLKWAEQERMKREKKERKK